MKQVVCGTLLFLFVHVVSCSLIDHVKPHVKPEDYTNTWVIEVDLDNHNAAKIAEFMASKGFGPLKRTHQFVGRRFMTFEHPTSRNTQIELDAAIRTKQFGILKAMRQYRQHHTTYPGGPKAKKMPNSTSFAVEPTNTFNDELYSAQWHLQNVGQSGGTPGADANVVPVWNMGLTGKGVQICIVDDGLEVAHPDFVEKFNSNGSYNFLDGSFDPTTDDPLLSIGHGTSCGGVAAASANNTECGVGAAYGATISGINYLATDTTDEQTAFSLTYKYNVNDIFSNSWGPIDDGYSFYTIDLLTHLAIEDATTNGRNGKGSVVLFAGGNGQEESDFASFNGYTNHHSVIAVAASDHNDVQSYYSEQGANILLCAPSSSTESGIVTSDDMGELGANQGSCTLDFGGTSSATPLVTGVVALMLEERPDLTVRDIKHILVNSVKKIDEDDAGWRVNGAGLHVNDKYGFGRIDAEAALNLTKSWTLVAPEYSMSVNVTLGEVVIPSNGDYVTRTLEIPNDILLENIAVSFAANVEFPTGIEMSVVSPSGTESKLAHARSYSSERVNVFAVGNLLTVGISAYRSSLVPVEGIQGNLVAAEPLDGCSPLTNAAEVAGNIVLMSNGGSCVEEQKFQNAINAGATNIIVFVDSVFGSPDFMAGYLPAGIVAIMIDNQSGRSLIENIDIYQELGEILNIDLRPVKDASLETPYNNGALFGSVQSWGESSRGTWTMKVRKISRENSTAINSWNSWGLQMYGTLIVASPSQSATPTATPTNTVTPSRTSTRTVTITQSPTNSVSPTNTNLSTRTSTNTTTTTTTTTTLTQSTTNTVTPSRSSTRTVTFTQGVTPTKTISLSQTTTSTHSVTLTQSVTPTRTSTHTVTLTRSVTPTHTATRSHSKSSSSTSTQTHSHSPAPSNTSTRSRARATNVNSDSSSNTSNSSSNRSSNSSNGSQLESSVIMTFVAFSVILALL